MRKIIAGLFITLDGVIEAPEKWNPPYYDQEMSQALIPRLAGASGTLIRFLLQEDLLQVVRGIRWALVCTRLAAG